MSETYLHLILNHLPVMSIFFSMFGLGYGIGFKKADVMKATLVLLIFGSIFTIPVFMTGDESELFLKKLDTWTIEKQIAVRDHENAAEITLFLNLLLGLLSTISLFLLQQERKISNFFLVITLLFCVLCFAFIVRTAIKGGEISHSLELVPTKNK